MLSASENLLGIGVLLFSALSDVGLSFLFPTEMPIPGHLVTVGGLSLPVCLLGLGEYLLT
jgi:hypothetical protein